MSDAEWQQFAAVTFAPWLPRTRAEFDAMCALGSARHLADNTGGQGFMHALAAEAMAFGADGEVNFPIDQRRTAYMKLHGAWPTDDELKASEAPRTSRPPGLRRIK
ncbi:hypothetical protein [Ramlibacter sp. AN1133]|uniref:hypothetical protein n=1 Tax=Ramlibacter sp. AN1133 TaxID=3133429 RepID=UPI0030C056B7